MDKSRIELLAPAGSFEIMKAVIAAGADAVYMGSSMFGARAYADNPDCSQFLEAIDYAHLRGKKLYLTINTLFKERELKVQLVDFLTPMYLRGLDAVIIQDMGVFEVVKEVFPKMDIHISTQAAVTGREAAAKFLELGASRVVTARELGIDELKLIADTGIEVESFVHGAICYCYSGKCLFSSLAGGRSGNRGRCAQPCRRTYSFFDEKDKKHALNHKNEEYLLSLKDMNTLSILPEIVKAGVYSLKIEGRMKKAEYAAGVVSIYRKYIDKILNGEKYVVDPEDEKNLFDLFNRNGFSKGYYLQKNSRKMMSLKENEFRIVDEELRSTIKSEYIDKELKFPVDFYATAMKGKAFELSAVSGDYGVSDSFDIVLASENSRNYSERIKNQLSKTGGTDFEVNDVQIFSDDDIYIPVSAINNARRSILQKLKLEMLKGFYRLQVKEYVYKKCKFISDERFTSISVMNSEQVRAGIEADIVSRIYLDSSAFDEIELFRCAGLIEASGKKSYIIIDEPLREEKKKYYDKIFTGSEAEVISGFVCESLESLAFVSERFKGKEIVLGPSLYSWNSQSDHFYKRFGVSCISAAYEENERELSERDISALELTVYGYLPMMVTANCLFKTCDACMGNSRKNRWGILKDEGNRRFAVRTSCAFCGNVIYNYVPLVLFDNIPLIEKLSPRGLRLDFTFETFEETEKVLRQYLLHEWEGELTRGHIKRGVE